MIRSYSIKLSTILNCLYIITVFLIISCQSPCSIPSEVYYPGQESQEEDVVTNIDDPYMPIYDIFYQYSILTEEEESTANIYLANDAVSELAKDCARNALLTRSNMWNDLRNKIDELKEKKVTKTDFCKYLLLTRIKYIDNRDNVIRRFFDELLKGPSVSVPTVLPTDIELYEVLFKKEPTPNLNDQLISQSIRRFELLSKLIKTVLNSCLTNELDEETKRLLKASITMHDFLRDSEKYCGNPDVSGGFYGMLKYICDNPSKFKGIVKTQSIQELTLDEAANVYSYLNYVICRIEIEYNYNLIKTRDIKIEGIALPIKDLACLFSGVFKANEAVLKAELEKKEYKIMENFMHDFECAIGCYNYAKVLNKLGGIEQLQLDKSEIDEEEIIEIPRENMQKLLAAIKKQHNLPGSLKSSIVEMMHKFDLYLYYGYCKNNLHSDLYPHDLPEILDLLPPHTKATSEAVKAGRKKKKGTNAQAKRSLEFFSTAFPNPNSRKQKSKGEVSDTSDSSLSHQEDRSPAELATSAEETEALTLTQEERAEIVAVEENEEQEEFAVPIAPVVQQARLVVQGVVGTIAEEEIFKNLPKKWTYPGKGLWSWYTFLQANAYPVQGYFGSQIQKNINDLFCAEARVNYCFKDFRILWQHIGGQILEQRGGSHRQLIAPQGEHLFGTWVPHGSDDSAFGFMGIKYLQTAALYAGLRPAED